MKVLYETKSLTNGGCDILIGKSSWNPNELSIKFAWKDVNGKRARGGEVPLSALPEMVKFAVKHNLLEFDLSIT